jgi:hypothetical protein
MQSKYHTNVFKIAVISRTLFRGSVCNKGYLNRFAYFSIVLLFVSAAPLIYTVAQIDPTIFEFDPNAKRFHFEISCNEFKEKTSSSGARIEASAINTNNDIQNNKNSFDISQSYYITEGDNGLDYYRNNCIAFPATAANTTNSIRTSNIGLTGGSEFIVQYNEEHYEPTTASLYPSDITDESILLDREKNKVANFKGSDFIREDEKSFLSAVPDVEGVFTVVLFEGITDESEAVHIIRNVKIVN